jgi:hypothetical protein
VDSRTRRLRLDPRSVLIAAAAAVLVGCAGAATPAPTTAPASVPASSPSTPGGAGSPSPTAAATATAVASPSVKPLALRQAPDNLGCDSIGIDYRRMTFRLDPDAAEPVSAITDTNVQLRTNWSAGFKQAPGGQRAIVDPAGQVVVTDGQTLDVPQAGYPRLAGYFVCLGPSEIYVLLQEPV